MLATGSPLFPHLMRLQVHLLESGNLAAGRTSRRGPAGCHNGAMRVGQSTVEIKKAEAQEMGVEWGHIPVWQHVPQVGKKPGHLPRDCGNAQDPGGSPEGGGRDGNDGREGRGRSAVGVMMMMLTAAASPCARFKVSSYHHLRPERQVVTFFFFPRWSNWGHCGPPAVSAGPGVSSPHGNPSGRPGKMSWRDESSKEWISLLLPCHFRSVPAQVPAGDALTGKLCHR